jgi:hypothetical protein
MSKKIYKIQIIDRKTNRIIQEETRKTQQAIDKLWCRCLTNVNPLIYKIKYIEEE